MAVQGSTPDGRLETPTAEPTFERAVIEAAISSAVAALEMILQAVQVGLVRVDGDRAQARTPITEWARRNRDSIPEFTTP